ncbi:radical SAM protein with 4Fe4S-binding SPASM domain [Allocatelliglobosispora scoriae]|uniref:Radical SAM protein with 4Fe4S-binding SPASM domain n=1 Tax=Allocatelliglobosispora scoriae TaxID=643052 RepID=A0A841BII3_9ACTN|nr:radical SAM protein [Allocatelliglobosispora scoriae]MBB5866711.1 radical SAM protein with 4Fe4S-binding SPASM domain [Allocatelliglobosispora scoriae]
MKPLIVDTHAASCYFRTSVGGDGRKALVQVTERCNLHCAHCFVSSVQAGNDMPVGRFTGTVLPRLLDARVERITLTGGEPFEHPDLMAMCRAVVDAGVSLGICTNATLVTDDHIAALVAMGNVHVNVSLDGFRDESHGRFRGDRSSFAVTVATVRRFAAAGLLKGLLSTPNMLTRADEFADLCEFAVEVGAEYMLTNPLSSFGRGVKSQTRMAADAEQMRAITAVTERFADRLDLVRIRFPNDDAKPLGGCDAGKLLYVYTDGDVASCPYLDFAARTPASPYPADEFIIGNINDGPVTTALDGYSFHDRYTVGTNTTCGGCALNTACGKGCPAAVISRGGHVGDLDDEQCPVAPAPGWEPLPVAAVAK